MRDRDVLKERQLLADKKTGSENTKVPGGQPEDGARSPGPAFTKRVGAFRLNLPSALHLETTAAHVPPPGLRYRALSNVAAVC